MKIYKKQYDSKFTNILFNFYFIISLSLSLSLAMIKVPGASLGSLPPCPFS